MLPNRLSTYLRNGVLNSSSTSAKSVPNNVFGQLRIDAQNRHLSKVSKARVCWRLADTEMKIDLVGQSHFSPWFVHKGDLEVCFGGNDWVEQLRLCGKCAGKNFATKLNLPDFKTSVFKRECLSLLEHVSLNLIIPTKENFWFFEQLYHTIHISGCSCT